MRKYYLRQTLLGDTHSFRFMINGYKRGYKSEYCWFCKAHFQISSLSSGRVLMDTRLAIIFVTERVKDMDLRSLPQNVDAIMTITESHVTLWQRGKEYSQVKLGDKISPLNMAPKHIMPVETSNVWWYFYSKIIIVRNLHNTIIRPTFWLLMHIR